MKKLTGVEKWLFLLVLGFGLYWLYLFVLFMAQVFVFGGYNFFFFLDNLLAVPGLDAVAVWAVFGLLPGSIAGTVVAIRRYQLSRRLVGYPVGATLLVLVLMGFVNKPLQYETAIPSQNGPEAGSSDIAGAAPALARYTLTSNVNVRSGPSVVADKLFVLDKYSRVEVVGAVRKGSAIWYRITHDGREGYVHSRFVRYAGTAD
jgi:hypothetical protein